MARELARVFDPFITAKALGGGTLPAPFSKAA